MGVGADDQVDVIDGHPELLQAFANVVKMGGMARVYEDCLFWGAQKIRVAVVGTGRRPQKCMQVGG
jgi:hypothetical protein